MQRGLGGCGQSTDRKLRRICGSSGPGLLGNKGQGVVWLGSAHGWQATSVVTTQVRRMTRAVGASKPGGPQL